MALQDVLECDSGLKAGGKSPFWVANDTGAAVSFWLAPSLEPARKRPPGEHLTAHHHDRCPQHLNSYNARINASTPSLLTRQPLLQEPPAFCALRILRASMRHRQVCSHDSLCFRGRQKSAWARCVS